MKRCRRAARPARAGISWLPAALCLALPVAVQAQAPEPTLAPSPAVRCLAPAEAERGEPVYPFEPWKRGEAGRVLVELSFTTTDRRPTVEVLSNEGDSAFVDAVKDHVARLRVPCLEYADIPVRLRQEYVFLPDRRSVRWTVPVDAADADRAQRMRCIVRTAGDGPAYPVEALRAQVRGRVLLEARFTAPEQPPETKVHAVGKGRRFEASVRAWAATLRMPCATGSPVTASYELRFMIEGDRPYGFKPLTLQQFMGSVRGIQQQRVQFDTTTMGCPFELRLVYRQPHLPNRVGEVGAPDPRRQPLLDWLAKAELDLKADHLESVFADTAPIHVACLRIDLDAARPAQ